MYKSFLGGNPDDAKRRIVDTNTFRTFSGESIHTCPSGMVMKGYEHSKGLLLCEPVGIDEATTHTDSTTDRMGMSACPSGQVMKGFKLRSDGTDVLVCTNLARF